MQFYDFRQNYNKDLKFHIRLNQLCMKLLNLDEYLSYTRTDVKRLILFLNESKPYIKYFNYPLTYVFNDICFIGFVDLVLSYDNQYDFIIFIDNYNDEKLLKLKGFILAAISTEFSQISKENINLIFINKDKFLDKNSEKKDYMIKINTNLKDYDFTSYIYETTDESKYSFLVDKL